MPKKRDSKGKSKAQFSSLEQRAVRPSIRAAELGLDSAQASPRSWPGQFWSQCLRETGCQPLPAESPSPPAAITLDEIQSLYTAVSSWSDRTRSTTAVDPKHETTIGSALFAIAILAEICENGVSQSILGRFALRTLLEVELTLAYLTKLDDAELWKSHRAFGAGQAKLQFLHLERLGREPTFVNINTLEALANEDQWQEFLKIDVGHWARLSLRDLSTKADLKNDYDSVYPWTSTYVHGHWGAIRDSVYGICLNPLHRLHRVPLEQPRILDPLLKDATELVNKIISIAQSVYPQVPINVSSDAGGHSLAPGSVLRPAALGRHPSQAQGSVPLAWVGGQTPKGRDDGVLRLGGAVPLRCQEHQLEDLPCWFVDILPSSICVSCGMGAPLSRRRTILGHEWPDLRAQLDQRQPAGDNRPDPETVRPNT